MVCQAPKKMPICPFGGSACQKRQCAGRSMLFVRRWTESGRLDVAGIHPLVEKIDGLAFTRALDARDQDQARGSAADLEVVLRFEQRSPKPSLLPPIRCLGDFVLEVCGFEHDEANLTRRPSSCKDPSQCGHASSIGLTVARSVMCLVPRHILDAKVPPRHGERGFRGAVAPPTLTWSSGRRHAVGVRFTAHPRACKAAQSIGGAETTRDLVQGTGLSKLPRAN